MSNVKTYRDPKGFKNLWGLVAFKTKAGLAKFEVPILYICVSVEKLQRAVKSLLKTSTEVNFK